MVNQEPLRTQQLNFVGLDQQEQDSFGISPRSADVPGKPSPDNGFRQDRAAMRDGKSFSGLPGLIAEDCAVLVSSGAIRDRSHEILTGADVGIAALYRSLMKQAKSTEAPEPPRHQANFTELSGYTRAINMAEQWRNH